MTAEDDMLHRLITLHDAQLPALRRFEMHYDSEQPLAYMHPELTRQLGDQIRQVVIAWPQLVVDAVEERLNIEGFRRPEEASGDDVLWEIWQANDMDAQAGEVHTEALALSRGYITLGSAASDGDPPVICAESAMDMFHITDPKTGETSAAVRRWKSDGEEGPADEADRATLYLPGKRVDYAKDGTDWKAIGEDTHDFGMLVEPVINRRRRRKPYGVSELVPALPLSEAACKIATDMMVGSNFHMLPQYYAIGVRETDFVDDQGNPLSIWKKITGRIFSTSNEKAQLGTLPASDMSNFHKTLDQLAQLITSQYGLPPHYLGFSTDNPASAEGIKSSEARLNLRAERKQGMFDRSWERGMRKAHHLYTGQVDPSLRLLETSWRDPSTPTVAQMADAAVKLYTTTPRPIVPLKQTRQRLRFRDAEIKQMEAEDTQAAANDPAMRIASALTH